MLRYIIKRVLLVIPVVLGVLMLVFIFQAISPDDPVRTIYGIDADDDFVEMKREEMGLNDPFLVQYARYVWNFVSKGDLGTSYQTKQPVAHEIMVRFPTTIKLALIAVFLGVFIGIPLGVLAAIRQYSLRDNVILIFSVLLTALPSFWLALMLIYLFAVTLHWLPSSGIDTIKGWILPMCVVALGSCSMIIRVTRSSMLETIRQDYIRTAYAKGQKESVIVIKHALRNSLIPIIASAGNSIGVQLGGALVVETVFGISGIGKYAVDAINVRNYPSVMGSVAVLAITFTLVNLVVDLVYSFVDPRITYSASKRRKRSSARKELKEV